MCTIKRKFDVMNFLKRNLTICLMRKILPHKGPSVLFYVEQNHIECQIPQIASHKAANDSNIQNFHNANNRAAHLAHFFLDPLNIFPPVACISFRFHANSSEIPVQNPQLELCMKRWFYNEKLSGMSCKSIGPCYWNRLTARCPAFDRSRVCSKNSSDQQFSNAMTENRINN